MLCRPLRSGWLAAAVGLIVGPVHGDEVQIARDIVYGRGGDVDLMLDLARPEGEGPFPAIIFIHGGGWYLGDRQGHHDDIQEAVRRGYAAASVSYRLMQFDEAEKESTTAAPIFPAQVHDVKAAVRWLRDNADKYRIDPKRIGATGGSAGGHLSLMLGLTDADDGLEGEGGHPDQSSRVQAVVNHFGPTELESCYKDSAVGWIFRLFAGGNPEEVPERYRAASPINYVTGDDPPVLTLHGDLDQLVPLAQSRLLDERMHDAGADHTLLILKGAGHGFGGKHREQAMTAQWEFFDAHLKP